MSTFINSQNLSLSSWVSTFNSWTTPVTTVLVYFGVVSIWNLYNRQNPSKPKLSSQFKFFVGLHNLILLVFSLITFVNVAPAIWVNFTTRSFMDAYCDRGQLVWNTNLGYWTWLFYLSKYYEMIDTLIILLKGNCTSTLQAYHHAGAIFTMWGAFHSKGFPSWVFVTFNSFIHTIMYAYYFLTTMNIRPPGKKYLTYLQITQFLVGGTICFSYIVTNVCNKTKEQQWALIAMCLYLLPLTYLFLQFAFHSYHLKTNNYKSKLI